MPLFATIAVVLALAAAALVVVPLLRNRAQPAPIAAALAALALPGTVLVAYLLVSNYHWNAPPVPAQAGSTATSGEAGSMEEALARLEARLARNPEDEEGWLLLGSSYASLGRPGDAIEAYQRALKISGGSNTDARLGIAEAQILLDRAALNGAAGATIEEILAAEPRNPKALWYGGLLAMNRGQTDLARTRWQALLELAPPERIRLIIEEQLRDLGAGGGAAAAAAPAPVPAAGGEPIIEVRVSVGAAVKSRISGTAPLFVFVRDSAGRGPPLAVIRRQAGELPLSLRISDADVMIPGRSLGSVSAAKVVARVANGGDPIPKPGDVYGEAAWTPGAEALAIVIDQVVE